MGKKRAQRYESHSIRIPNLSITGRREWEKDPHKKCARIEYQECKRANLNKKASHAELTPCVSACGYTHRDDDRTAPPVAEEHKKIYVGFGMRESAGANPVL